MSLHSGWWYNFLIVDEWMTDTFKPNPSLPFCAVFNYHTEALRYWCSDFLNPWYVVYIRACIVIFGRFRPMFIISSLDPLLNARGDSDQPPLTFSGAYHILERVCLRWTQAGGGSQRLGHPHNQHALAIWVKEKLYEAASKLQGKGPMKRRG